MFFCFLPAGQLPLNLKSLSFYSRSSSLKQTHLDFPLLCVFVCVIVLWFVNKGAATCLEVRAIILMVISELRAWFFWSGYCQVLPIYAPVSAILFSPWLSLLSSPWPDLIWERRHLRNFQQFCSSLSRWFGFQSAFGFCHICRTSLGSYSLDSVSTLHSSFCAWFCLITEDWGPVLGICQVCPCPLGTHKTQPYCCHSSLFWAPGSSSCTTCWLRLHTFRGGSPMLPAWMLGHFLLLDSMAPCCDFTLSKFSLFCGCFLIPGSWLN